MIEKYFTTQKTSRVYYSTEDYSKVKFVWFALHGYGQLGKFFARTFEVLNTEEHLIVVPEAQSRFYLEGVYGRVGASWMTKEDREIDIKDYLNYLDNLYFSLKNHFQKDIRVIVFGFSQGAATACRWVNDGSIKPQHLVLWSSIFPPDLRMDGSITDGTLQLWLAVGDSDEYMNEERWKENHEIMEKMSLDPKVIHFKGGHQIVKNELSKLAQRIEKT